MSPWCKAILHNKFSKRIYPVSNKLYLSKPPPPHHYDKVKWPSLVWVLLGGGGMRACKLWHFFSCKFDSCTLNFEFNWTFSKLKIEKYFTTCLPFHFRIFDLNVIFMKQIHSFLKLKSSKTFFIFRIWTNTG